MALIEKMMDRLVGIHCFLRYAATSNTRRREGDGQMSGWIFFNKEVTKAFQHCLKSDGLILHMHAIEGHSGVEEPRLILHF